MKFEVKKPLFKGLNPESISKAIATHGKGLYPVILSKMLSVTPQRHCGFIVPKICKASQVLQKISASVTATQIRLKSAYDGMTLQNNLCREYAGRHLTAESESRHHNFLSMATYSKSQNVKEASHA